MCTAQTSPTRSVLGIVLCGAWALTACETPPAVRFELLTPAAPRNLVDVLGPTSRLLGPDTTHFVLTYDPRTQLNHFSLVNANDTAEWFSARAFRYRGLYYLITPGPDLASSWVHAARITNHTVQGLSTEYSQMADLSAAVEAGSFAELVRFRSFSADSVVLRFEKAALHRFYRTLPDSFPVYRLEKLGFAASSPPISKSFSSTSAFSVYPNPATQAVTVAFDSAGIRTIYMLDAAGREVLTASCSTATVSLSLDNLKAGTYLVRVATAQEPARRSYRLKVVR